MAQKTIVSFACDYDLKDIEDNSAQTRHFSLDGQQFELDLCDRHNDLFERTLGKWTDKARRPVRTAAPRRRTTAHRSRSAAIRTWARENRMPVSERGRIPASVVREYEAAH